jgi:hypothetical protein
MSHASGARHVVLRQRSKGKKKPAHARAILAQLAPPSTGAFDYLILIT